LHNIRAVAARMSDFAAEFVAKVETLYSAQYISMPQMQREIRTSLSDINMVPFIDVVLVLLIIFMITAPILQSGIDVDVPKTKTVKELAQVRMVITIDKAQRVYLNDSPVNIHDLGNQLFSQMKDPAHQAVYVRCDETVP